MVARVFLFIVFVLMSLLAIIGILVWQSFSHFMGGQLSDNQTTNVALASKSSGEAFAAEELITDEAFGGDLEILEGFELRGDLIGSEPSSGASPFAIPIQEPTLEDVPSTPVQKPDSELFPLSNDPEESQPSPQPQMSIDAGQLDAELWRNTQMMDSLDGYYTYLNSCLVCLDRHNAETRIVQLELGAQPEEPARIFDDDWLRGFCSPETDCDLEVLRRQAELDQKEWRVAKAFNSSAQYMIYLSFCERREICEHWDLAFEQAGRPLRFLDSKHSTD